ncbi:MAG TPA: hypothetical protein VFT87_04265 [Candidatus Saccharimonadales bacterium]|nr:hypothetical protein [Candidatus Saccharimonadales bacterium]
MLRTHPKYVILLGVDRTAELPQDGPAEQTEILLSPQIIDEGTARNLAVFFSEFATRGVEQFTDALHALTRTQKLEIGDGKNKQTIELNQQQIEALITPPGRDNQVLEELFDNQPQILSQLLEELSRARPRSDKSQSEQSRRAELSLIHSISLLSNLFLILRGDETVQNRQGIWQ